MAKKINNRWFGTIFGLLFTVIGLIAAYFTAGDMLLKHRSSANWVEVPATIHHLELDKHYTRRSRTTGSSSNRRKRKATYNIVGAYSYAVNGEEYQSDRISLTSGSDSSIDYWTDLLRSLRADQKGDEATAFVNPDDPTESVLDRTFRWVSILIGSAFLILFSGIGLAITFASLTGRFKKSN